MASSRCGPRVTAQEADAARHRARCSVWPTYVCRKITLKRREIAAVMQSEAAAGHIGCEHATIRGILDHRGEAAAVRSPHDVTVGNAPFGHGPDMANDLDDEPRITDVNPHQGAHKGADRQLHGFSFQGIS